MRQDDMSNERRKPYRSQREIHGVGQDRTVFPSVESYEVFRRRQDLLPQLDLHLENVLGRAGKTKQELQLVRSIVGGYAITRYERGKQLRSEKVRRARSIAQQFFNEEVGDDVQVEFNLCMDRRTRKTLMLGVPGGFGASKRYPAGKPEGFSRKGIGGALYLDPDSNYGVEIADSLQNNRYVLLVVDSHFGCLARTDIEENKLGVAPPDSGVRADRRYKGEMVRAIKELAAGSDSEVIVVRTSFDPHSGYLSLLDEERFEEEVISTRNIARSLRNTFVPRHNVRVDWLGDYEESSLQFWEHIRDMKAEALPIVKAELKKVYPHLEKQDPVQFGMKARVALLSAYSGWLNNLGRKYQHDVHNENLVVASSGGEHGPFPDYEAFEIAVDSPVIREDALYASRLVRGVRRAGHAYGELSDPVPFILQAQIELTDRGQVPYISELCTRVSDQLEHANNWRSLSFENIVGLIRKLGKAGGEGTYQPSLDLGIAVAKHFQTMGHIYDPRHPFSEYIHEGSIVPISLVVDQDKTPLALLRIAS